MTSEDQLEQPPTKLRRKIKIKREFCHSGTLFRKSKTNIYLSCYSLYSLQSLEIIGRDLKKLNEREWCNVCCSKISLFSMTILARWPFRRRTNSTKISVGSNFSVYIFNSRYYRFQMPWNQQKIVWFYFLEFRFHSPENVSLL